MVINGDTTQMSHLEAPVMFLGRYYKWHPVKVTLRHASQRLVVA